MERISPRFLNTFPPDKMLCHPYWMAEPPFRIWGNLYFVGNSWCSSHLIDTGDPAGHPLSGRAALSVGQHLVCRV